MAIKPSVDEKIKKVSETCSKQLSELQEMLEKPDSVDDASMDAVEEALREMGTGWYEGFKKCWVALQAKKKPDETVHEIAMGGGEIGSAPGELSLKDVL